MREFLLGTWIGLVGLGLVGLAGCGDDEGGEGTPDDPATACNEANEDCAPGICGGEGPTMLPGSDCVSCHREGSGAGEEDEPLPSYTVAGTIFDNAYGDNPASGVTIRITDAMGTVLELTSNSAGNFYATDMLVAPLRAEVEKDGRTLQMMAEVNTGACNTCHRCGGMAGGKLYAP